MKWLNIINDSDTFSEIIYELYSSQKEFNKYSAFIPQMQALLKNKAKVFNDAKDKINKYAKKIKKQSSDIYSFNLNDAGHIIFTPIDEKMSEMVKDMNDSWIYIDKLSAFLNTSYVFTNEDLKLMPELKDMSWPKERFVYSIPFSQNTSWEKLNVSEQLRHAFVVALAMTQISEDIV